MSRLQDMGIEPFLLSTSLLGVLAQRLVRTLCPSCRQPYAVDEEQAKQTGLAVGTTLYHPGGCEKCNYSGYRGRTGIHELLLIDDTVRTAIHRGESELGIARMLGDGRITIRQDGMDKVLAGITTWEEVVRVTKEE
ncbi:hypothetical protein OS42_42060 [Dickeya oryzae]